MSRPRCGDAGGVTKAGQPCRSTAVFADSGLCLAHDPTRAEERQLAEQLRIEAVSAKVDQCQYPRCKKAPPPGHRYCGPAHRNKAKHLRQRVGGTLEIALSPTDRLERRGWVYDELEAQGLMPLLSSGAMRQAEAAAAISATVAAVSRAVATWQIDQAVKVAAEDWVRPELPPLAADTIDAWVDAFIGFREAHFLTRDGNPFITTDYMLRWIRAIFEAIVTGGRLLILSPPRHGKTELLTHLAIFLICYNPNINIMWVSKAEDVARASVRAIMDHLENNVSLIRAFCPPGTKFKPDRGRTTKEWSPSGGQFTVATRTITGITSPTMVALSRTGTVRNRSADLIVMDDLEDHKSTRDEAQREATREFLATELESRKEDHTAWFGIGSRAHAEDWYHFALLDPEWEVIVEEAHSSECALDPYDEEIHVDCMLWPGVRTYAWLQQKFRSAEAAGRRDLAEMVYLNRAAVAGARTFTAEVVDPAMNRNRVMGKAGIPAGSNLIAGLDPSHTGFQAAFLWAYQVDIDSDGTAWLKLAMIDLENRKGGGIRAVRESVAAWWEMYQLRMWVIEENLLRDGIKNDEPLRDYCASRGIYLADYMTGGEKWDRALGISSMEPMYRNHQIDLPYGDAPSMQATNLYRAQLLRFGKESKVTGRNRPSDLVMASWFPLETMRFELAAFDGVIESSHDPAYASEDYQEGIEPW